jgi:hypothetical protein
MLSQYVLIWMAVAGLSLAYLTYLGVRPDILAKRAEGGPNIERDLAAAKRDMARAFADLDPLRQSVGEIKMDVANLKSAAQEASYRDTILLERMSALESKAVKPQGVAQARDGGRDATIAPAAAPPAPKPDPRKSAAVKATKTEAAASPAAAPPAAAQKTSTPGNGAQKSADPIDTGSIERAAKATAATKPPPVGVLLATGPSVDALRLNWSILTDRHADAVKNLQPRYIVSGKAQERTYGLVAGPVASTEQAKSLCLEMEKRGLACEVSPYRGNAL